MELATRGARLKAYLIDLFIAIVLVCMKRFPLGDVLNAVGLLGLIAFVVYQCVLLTKHGQTIGKRMIGIRIVKLSTGENGGFVANVILRSVITVLLNIIPLYFFVDTLFIFRDDRRCIHDFIAGTKVIEGQPV